MFSIHRYLIKANSEHFSILWYYSKRKLFLPSFDFLQTFTIRFRPSAKVVGMSVGKHVKNSALSNVLILKLKRDLSQIPKILSQHIEAKIFLLVPCDNDTDGQIL